MMLKRITGVGLMLFDDVDDADERVRVTVADNVSIGWPFPSNSVSDLTFYCSL
jgi:hypothetical protein